MTELLLLSDDKARTERRFRSLESLGQITILDIHDRSEALRPVDVVIGDVGELSAHAVSRLRRVLEKARPSDGHLVLVMHGDGARARTYAEVLKATAVVPFSDLAGLTAVVERLVVEGGDVPLTMRVHASRARNFLRETFSTGTLTQDEVANGTEAVARAIGASGIYDWIRAVREFDDATHQHILLVAGLAAAFAGTLRLSAGDRHRVVKAALLHDVGKTRVPTAVLNKPGRLDAAETSLMRTHAAEGHSMLAAQGFEEVMLRVARSHHEMLDGSGYPDGLAGADVPDLVRLVTVCDIHGALIERRPYRAPMCNAAAFDVLVRMGRRLDPDLVRAFKPVVISPLADEGLPAVVSEVVLHA